MVKKAVVSSVDSLVEKSQAFCHSLSNISTLESNLGCIDGQIIGTGRADYTQSSTEYKLNVNDKDFLLIDIPGIEGDEGKYKEIIKASLAKAHVIFYVNGSGKKAEKDTLDKIKNYMHDGTSVYAVFNVHCKAKKNRIPGIDKTYQEELKEAYEKQREIVKQTEGELKSFLGDNFKESVCLNGLLSFCSVAKKSDGKTTIIAKEEDKDLQATQSKFLKEYSGDWETMHADSGILGAQGIITDKIEHFEEYILEENIKKLRTRLADILSDITVLRDKEKKKIKTFRSEYDTFEKNCALAKDDFIQTIKQIGRREVSVAFSAVQEELFDEIERSKGKIASSSVEAIFTKHKEQIAQDIQNAVSNKIQAATKEYQEAIQEAEKRLYKDLERGQTKFSIEMKSDKIYFDTSFQNALSFNMKDFSKGAFKVFSYTVSFATVGSIIPGIGNIIGGVIGFFAGIGFAIVDFFSSEAKRINRAKERLKSSIDDQIDNIVAEVKSEIKTLGIEDEIDKNHSAIQKRIAEQKKSLQDIGQLLDMVITDLSNRYQEV